MNHKTLMIDTTRDALKPDILGNYTDVVFCLSILERSGDRSRFLRQWTTTNSRHQLWTTRPWWLILRGTHQNWICCVLQDHQWPLSRVLVCFQPRRHCVFTSRYMRESSDPVWERTMRKAPEKSLCGIAQRTEQGNRERGWEWEQAGCFQLAELGT